MENTFPEEQDKILENEQIYDAALTSMISKMDEYVVPLVNEVFGERFTERAQVIVRSNKHVIQRTYGALSRRETDCVAELSEQMDQKVSRTYIFECEA